MMFLNLLANTKSVELKKNVINFKKIHSQEHVTKYLLQVLQM